ncbi:MAG: hypothetical protein ACYTAF_03690 [Planctomycetota bacterium]|jgi:hypothetical protein
MPPPKTRTEIKVNVAHKAGELTNVLKTVSQAGCNLLAFCGYGKGADSGEILMVPDHEGKARRALEAAGYEPQMGKVVVVPSPAGKGAGAKLAAKLSDFGINVEYAYASSTSGGKSVAVFRVAEPDIEKALKAFS